MKDELMTLGNITVSAVPHWGRVLPVSVSVSVSVLLVPAAMRCRLNWREEQVVVPTALRPLWWARWIGC
jgi:hypothetical protein